MFSDRHHLTRNHLDEFLFQILFFFYDPCCQTRTRVTLKLDTPCATHGKAFIALENLHFVGTGAHRLLLHMRYLS